MPLSAGEFIERVIDNDLDAVRQAMSESPSLVAARDRLIGSTALHFAAHRGFTQMVRSLLDAGADVHALETASESAPLHWAAEGGHPAIARMLISRGAALESLDCWFRLSPLGWASVVTWAPPFHEDKPATASQLLAAGAELDAFTAVALGRGDDLRRLATADAGTLSRQLGFVAAAMQPLHVAVARRVGPMVTLLLDLGADIEARTAMGMTPLALALEDEDATMAGLLRGHGAPEDAAVALVEDNLGALGARLDEGDDPGLAQALLFAAVGSGRTAAVAMLVDRGADPNARIQQLVGEVPAEVTPLHIAAKKGHAAAVSALIAAGARPDAGSEDRLPTPLHLAAGDGRAEAVRVLLDAGASAGAEERLFGSTPSGWAAHSGHDELADLLRRAVPE
jgi:ankyrin repeat protein